jgi:hypothetical protein
MPTNTRAQLKALITKAIRDNPATPAFETAQKVGASSGLCRAVWAVLTVDQRNALVRQAAREAKRAQV